MNKILHLCRLEKFTDHIINFINDNFCVQNHSFFVYGSRVNIKKYNIQALSYENVTYIHSLNTYFAKSGADMILLGFDKIIIHSLFDYDLINLCVHNKKILKKSYIYLFGGDFYPESLKNENLEMKLKRRYLLRNARGIINIIPEENRIMKRLYHPKGKLLSATYGIPDLNLNDSGEKSREVINIQIGNSATESNHHKRVIDELCKFKNENIKVYVPLSYGNNTYAREVKKYGESVLGEKFVPIMDYMPLEAYNQLLAQMHVAIFDIERQQALGNINAQYLLGSIIYFRRRSVNSVYYRKTVGCKVRCIEDISHMSLEEFSSQTEKEKKRNLEQIRYRYDPQRITQEWKKVFES